MVFYFTGTGNSLYAAKQLDDRAISIPQLLNSQTLEFSADSIGIVCPIYGHEMPAMVKEFIRKSTLCAKYLYLILTYGKRHANAVELAERVFAEAGKRLDYCATLLMVDNFLPVFDMDEEMEQDKQVESQLAAIRSDVMNRVKKIEPVTDQDRQAHRSYLALVNNAAETVWADFTITDDCVGCGICTKVCPAGCIYLEEQRAMHTGVNCQACFACIHACPKLAIRLPRGEKNPQSRYRNPNTTLGEIVSANDQTARSTGSAQISLGSDPFVRSDKTTD